MPLACVGMATVVSTLKKKQPTKHPQMSFCSIRILRGYWGVNELGPEASASIVPARTEADTSFKDHMLTIGLRFFLVLLPSFGIISFSGCGSETEGRVGWGPRQQQFDTSIYYESS
jgi:hypothetical protein